MIPNISQSLLLVFLLIIPLMLCCCNDSQYQPTIVKSLPGFRGDLPFRLETGYIGVGESEQVQLFYYYIESERDVERDPLIFWLTGGPGCSGVSGLALEIGPIAPNYTAFNNYDPESPIFLRNQYAWTKIASIVFLDSPAGTGFSYATTPEAYYNDDILQAEQVYQFIRKWLVHHPKFIRKHIYVNGDSYSGKIVPIVVQNIINGNEMGLSPKVKLQGYTLGNPVTRDPKNVDVEYAHRISLLSDELYERAKINCNGDYSKDDANNTQCSVAIDEIYNDIDGIYKKHVLEPTCNEQDPTQWCREQQDQFLSNWANTKMVQETLNIREGTVDYWVRCNRSMWYSMTVVDSTVGYHQNLTKTALRALIYSGDQDLLVPYIDTLEWIQNLHVPLDAKWRPWMVEGQVAGYVTNYSNSHYELTFTTIKGGGHAAPEFKPQECLAMFDRWLTQHYL